MLNRENRQIMLCFILCIISFGCKRYKTYDTKEINDIREKSIAKVHSIIGKDEYFKIYAAIKDSIEDWKFHNLGYYKYMGVSKDYLIDSILCVNKKGNKLITTILQKQLLEDGVQDDIWYFYGVKINTQWYFFCGPTLVLPREFYQEDIHTPLSFEKLKQIATNNIYRRYLKKGEKGEWEINEHFFDQVIPAGNLKQRSRLKTEEEYVRFMVEVNWSSDVNETIRKFHEE